VFLVIVYRVSIGSLRVEDMDSDGLTVRDGENHVVWMTHEQLDDLAKLSVLLREINA
jgi:hypothetical protein